MRILIIGGTGLVGRYLVSRCVAAGHNVTVVSRSAATSLSGARVIQGDISQPGWLAIVGIDPFAYDFVVHLAYSINGGAAYDRAVTVTSVVDTLRYFAGASLKHFIYVGSMSVFGLDLPAGILDEQAPRVPDNEYALNKIDASAAVMSADIACPVSVLHPTGVYDAFSKRLVDYRNLLNNGYIVLDAGGRGINNIVHADDVAIAIVTCLTRRRGDRAEEYVINGEGICYSEWFEVLERHLGVENEKRVPLRFLALCHGPLRRLLRAIGLRPPIVLPDYKRAMFERGAIFSSGKAGAHFEWKPVNRFVDINSASLAAQF